MWIVAFILAVTVLRVNAQPIVKIAKGLGDHGYGSLRVSVITDRDDERTKGNNATPFTYDAPFAWKWPQYHLQSYLAKNLRDGIQSIEIGNDAYINVNLPKEGSGVRGIVFGDPCVEPDFVGCIHFNDNSTMKDRLPRLVNAVSSSTEWRAIIGDNFYDQSGNFTGNFYRALTSQAQSIIEITALGNHDLWRPGFPQARSHKDTYGNGYLQFYGQDSVLSRDDSAEYMDLSIDPNKYIPPGPEEETNFDTLPASRERPDSIPPAKNFLSYHTVGNTGFISYSGAHTWESYGDEFENACKYFDSLKEETSPKIIILAGHWNQPHLGCQKDMDVPAVYEKLRQIPGCDKDKMRYIAGHVHCNEPMGWTDASEGTIPIGYMLGGTGVRGERCNTFGFGYFSTTNNRELVVGFTLGTDISEENAPDDIFDEAITCFETKGIEKCLEYGTIWRDTAL